jgi:hypothetical protein
MRLSNWRTVLPVVQVATYVSLVWYGCWYRPTWQYWFHRWASRSTESTGFNPTWIDGVESFPEQLAAGINFPAALVAAISLLPFRDLLRTGASSELAMHLVTALYVPLVWYWVGKRLDEGFKVKSLPASQGGSVVAVVCLVALLCVAAVMTWSLVEGQRYTAMGLSLVWIGYAIFVVSFSLRRNLNRLPVR